MNFQSPIVSEINECIEKTPKKRQIKLLCNLKKELQLKRKKTTQKDIQKISKLINKSILRTTPRKN